MERRVEELAKVREHREDPVLRVQTRKRMQKQSDRAPAKLILPKEQTMGPTASHRKKETTSSEKREAIWIPRRRIGSNEGSSN
jgi:dihydroxyacetone kinase-like predicted kinase